MAVEGDGIGEPKEGGIYFSDITDQPENPPPSRGEQRLRNSFVRWIAEGRPIATPGLGIPETETWTAEYERPSIRKMIEDQLIAEGGISPEDLEIYHRVRKLVDSKARKAASHMRHEVIQEKIDNLVFWYSFQESHLAKFGPDSIFNIFTEGDELNYQIDVIKTISRYLRESPQICRSVDDETGAVKTIMRYEDFAEDEEYVPFENVPLTIPDLAAIPEALYKGVIRKRRELIREVQERCRIILAERLNEQSAES